MNKNYPKLVRSVCKADKLKSKRIQMTLYLHLEHVKHLAVSSPSQQEFPGWTPFLKRPGRLSPPTPVSVPPSSPPLAEVDASVPEPSTPPRLPQREETPARPGPTRTADAWRARRRSSAMSSYWRVMRENRWLRWGPRGSKAEEVFPEGRIHHSQRITARRLIDGVVGVAGDTTDLMRAPRWSCCFHGVLCGLFSVRWRGDLRGFSLFMVTGFTVTLWISMLEWGQKR